MKKPNNKHLLTKYSQKMARRHLVMGAMGNISVRDRGEVWIKRGGAWLGKAKPGDFIRIDIKTGRAEKGQKVSEEINLHLGCLRARTDINAVIHTHPVITTAIGTILAKNGRKSAKLGIRVAIIKYYQPGSMALAKAVKKAIKISDAVIMAQHGLVVVGKTLKDAYQKTLKIEVSSSKLIRRALNGQI